MPRQNGWTSLVKDRKVNNRRHGYDNDAAGTRALFIASGPGIAELRVLPAFDNVAVCPLLARLIGVPPRANEGGDALADALVKR